MTANTVTTGRESRFRAAPGTCLDCAGDVASELRRLRGVQKVEVMSAIGLVVVRHNGHVTSDDVTRRAERLGLKLIPADVRTTATDQPWWSQAKLIALAVSGLLLLVGLGLEKVLTLETLATAFYFATLAVGGFFPARSGLKALRTGHLTISTLLVAAAAGAVALGVFEEAALLVVVFSLGEVLEEYAADRARGAIRALMALAPRLAQRRAAGGSLETVPVETLAPDDVIVVRPGDRVPTDGTVIDGISAVDQSPVTGESIPVEVTIGSTVFGGTVNGTGALQVRVTKEYADTILARIIRQVEEAQASKGKAQRFADRFGAVYTPAMFFLAASIAVLPPLFAGDFRDWFYRALVVLTVSCSCALVISVPVAVVAAISRAARSGILIKGGAYLEVLATIKTTAFDKTGTLTRGRPTVTDILPLNGHSPDEVLRLAASVEAASEHPLAGAIVRAAEERGIRWAIGRELRATPSMGVEATVEGQRLFVGKPTGPARAGVARQLERLQAEGKTAVVLAREGQPVATLAVADEVRDGAVEVIAALRNLAIQPIVMLTGDNKRTAAAIAHKLGIDDWHADLLPEQKTESVKKLRAECGRIAMVGDGVNDAPALATADLGIAMGAAGTDVALETADVALMGDDLAKLPEAILLARRALDNIRQNIVLSLATVAVLVIAALSGWLSLTTGLLLNEGTALLIIANGLRLLTPPPRLTRKSL